MALVLAFGLVLLVSVSLSGVAARTVLSTALLFLAAGAVIGQGVLGLINVAPSGPLVTGLADVALFTVLFADGQRASLPHLREGWRLAGRALGLAMPLMMVGVAVPAHYLADLDWPTALLLGAILSPTDPVFASAIVGRRDVPTSLRRLLNVESGLNDGLALPFVLVLLSAVQHEQTEFGKIGGELLLGLAVGIIVPLVVAFAWRHHLLTADPRLRALGPLALAITVYGVCDVTHANPYLAAFAAGSTLATVDRRSADEFERLGDLLSELTKFAALLVFGALITPDRLSDLTLATWLLAGVVIIVVRPASMQLSLVRSSLPMRERHAAAWFGPKGFASVVYGLLVVEAGIPQGEVVFDLVAVTIALSIVLHSSTDILVARALRVDPPESVLV